MSTRPTTRVRRSGTRAVLVALIAAVAAILLPGNASAAPAPAECATRNNNTYADCSNA